MPRRPFNILMFHSVAPLRSGERRRAMSVPPLQFRRQMAWLKRLGIHGLSLREAIDRSLSSSPGRFVAVTFDDGYLDNLEFALPILQEFKFTATCYFVSGLLGQTNRWDTGKHAERPLMTAEQLREWSKANMEVGAHSRSHLKLTDLPPNKLAEEILESKTQLERITGEPVTSFAYPFGAKNSDVIDAVKKAGFLSAVTTARFKASERDSLHLLPRIPVNSHQPWPLFLLRLWTSKPSPR